MKMSSCEEKEERSVWDVEGAVLVECLGFEGCSVLYSSLFSYSRSIIVPQLTRLGQHSPAVVAVV